MAVYRDSVGALTIGVGRNLDAKGVSESEADLMLANDIADVFADLDRKYPWWRQLPPQVQRGLANMCFNLGVTRLTVFAKMLAALQRGDYNTAAFEALDSRWAVQVGMRATRIANLFRSAGGTSNAVSA